MTRARMLIERQKARRREERAHYRALRWERKLYRFIARLIFTQTHGNIRRSMQS
jgi:hypothetical protein